MVKDFIGRKRTEEMLALGEANLEMLRQLDRWCKHLDGCFGSLPPVKQPDACRAEAGKAHAPRTTADGLSRLDYAAAGGSG